MNKRKVLNILMLVVVVMFLNSTIGICQGGRTMGARFGTIDIESITSSASEVNILDGATLDVNDLNLLDGTVAGTAVASKVLTLGASKDVDELHVTSKLNWLQQVETITGTYDSLTVVQSGQVTFYRDITSKATAVLPPAATGLFFDFYIADSDSLLITAGASDSLIVADGTGWVVTTSVAGSVRMVAADAIRWMVIRETGSWVSY